MNRNIEVGCLVMVVANSHPDMLGKSGRVISFDEDDESLPWEVDFGDSLDTKRRCWNSDPAWCHGSQLKRIDNHDTSADEIERYMEMVK